MYGSAVGGKKKGVGFKKREGKKKKEGEKGEKKGMNFCKILF